LLLACGAFDHIELYVLQAGGLRDLPVDTSTYGCRHCSHIDDEVSDLAEEVVLVGVPIRACVFIWIRIDESNTDKASCALDGRASDGVANELGIV